MALRPAEVRGSSDLALFGMTLSLWMQADVMTDESNNCQAQSGWLESCGSSAGDRHEHARSVRRLVTGERRVERATGIEPV